MIYEKLSRLRFLNRYSHKFLFVAFIGIHIPLIILMVLLAFQAVDRGTSAVLWVALGATLLATGLTLLTLNRLLSPIMDVSRAVREYRKRQQLPNLPTHYEDEAGQLMLEVQLTLRRLDQASRDQEDLIGLLSHDMRSPASSALGLAQYLRSDDSLPLHIQEMGAELEKLSQSQLEMLDNILSFLRTADQHDGKLSKKTVPVRELIDNAISKNQTRIDSKAIEVRVNHDEEAMCQGSTELMQSILDNLVSNAIKFSHAGGPVTIQTSRLEEVIKIAVQDSGMGFTETIRQQLFERFTRAGRAGTQGEASTGLGLYLCRRIARLHGGDIEAHSDGPGMGSTFTVTLPLSSPEKPS